MEQLRNYLQASKAGIEASASDYSKISNHLNEVFDRISKLSASDGNILGLSTGFREIDNMIGGMEPGELIVVKGVRDTGVTAFLMTLALHAARANTGTVLFFSREEMAQQLTRRFLSLESQVRVDRIEKGKLTDQEMQMLMIASAYLCSMDIRIFDQIGEIDEIRRICSEIADPILIIVDSLSDEDCPALDQLHFLKQLAEKKQAVVLCSCWLREMADYSLCGADKVLLIKRQAAIAPYYDETKAVCKVERNIHGKNGEIDLYWDPGTLAFFPIDNTREKDIPPEISNV